MAAPTLDDEPQQDLWARPTLTEAESMAERAWKNLVGDARAVTFPRIHEQVAPPTAAPAAPPSESLPPPPTSTLLILPDGSRPSAIPKQAGRDQALRTTVNKYLDSYALHSRLDAVDESLRPFVPFVRPLTPREMSRFEYGILLNPAERTMLLEYPFYEPAEDDVAQWRDAADTLTTDPLNSSGVEPSSPEAASEVKYRDVFLAQLRVVPVYPPEAQKNTEEEPHMATATTNTSASKQQPVAFRVGLVPCFRLRFRRLANTSARGAIGTFVLASVLVSGHRFWDLHDDLRRHVAMAPNVDYYSRLGEHNSSTLQQRQEAWAAWVRLTAGSVLSDPRDPRPVQSDTVATATQLVNGTPLQDKNRLVCGFDVPGLGALEELDTAVVPEAPAASSINCGTDFIPRRCEYGTDRMARRVVVLPRRVGVPVPQLWGALCAELTGEAADGPAAPAAGRIILKDTRAGTNFVDSGEVVVFVPPTPTALVVYESEAEEQLREWISSALATAEVHGLHLLLLRLDLPLIISRCPGLLALPLRQTMDKATPAAVAAREHALRVILETVEDFVQGGGVVWRVVVLIEAEPDLGGSEDWFVYDAAVRRLQTISLRKEAAERATPVAPSPVKGCSTLRKPRAMAEDDIQTLSPSRKGSSPTAARASNNAGPPPPPPPPPAAIDYPAAGKSNAYTLGGVPSEDELQRLFRRLDVKKDGALDRTELKRLLQPPDENAKQVGRDVEVTDRMTYLPRRKQASYLACGTCLSSIDDCGVPLTDRTIDGYLSKYSRLYPGKVTYPEFAALMLDLARR